MSKKNNRVAGIIGVSVHKANLNADFEGNPRSNSFGFDASHASLKYPYREWWKTRGHKVYYLREFGKNMEYMKPKEKFEKISNEKLKQNQKEKVVKNLLDCVDVHNFGATFAETKNNVSIRGVVQPTDGINIYEDAEIDRTSLLNPFVNSKSDDAGNTTLGSRAVLNEAHFVFGFTVMPHVYDKYIGKIDGFEGYTEENYQLFKKASLSAVTEYQSVAKAGCKNEFALFVNFKEGSLVAVSELHTFISYQKEDNLGIFDATRLTQYLNKFAEDIDNVELYYDEFGCKFQGLEDLKCDLIKRSILDESELD